MYLIAGAMQVLNVLFCLHLLDQELLWKILLGIAAVIIQTVIFIMITEHPHIEVEEGEWNAFQTFLEKGREVDDDEDAVVDGDLYEREKRR